MQPKYLDPLLVLDFPSNKRFSTIQKQSLTVSKLRKCAKIILNLISFKPTSSLYLWFRR